MSTEGKDFQIPRDELLRVSETLRGYAYTARQLDDVSIAHDMYREFIAAAEVLLEQNKLFYTGLELQTAIVRELRTGMMQSIPKISDRDLALAAQLLINVYRIAVQKSDNVDEIELAVTTGSRAISVTFHELYGV